MRCKPAAVPAGTVPVQLALPVAPAAIAGTVQAASSVVPSRSSTLNAPIATPSFATVNVQLTEPSATAVSVQASEMTERSVPIVTGVEPVLLVSSLSLIEAPECLPDGWREAAGSPGSRATAEAVRDYIAGMTDRFALDEHDRLYKLARDRT